MKKYLTSEYVGIGHPDKVADQISDTILDMYLEKDKNSRVAVETLVSGNNLIIAGEITSNHKFIDDEIKSEIIKTVDKIGYNKLTPCSFRSDNLNVQILLKPQSQNIHDGVDKSDGNIGAGDQGIMFGYANAETPYYLPLPYVIAGELLNRLNNMIVEGKVDGVYTDNKSQVCCSYENGKIQIEKIVLSTFHDKKLSINDVRRFLREHITTNILHKYEEFVPRDREIEMFFNSAGDFWIGGPEADAGVTGRKIIVDTYGGFAPHGGGAFSGKDPSKVDRSAAYMARHIAKNISYNFEAKEVLVQLSYAIGHTQPFSISVKSDSYLNEESVINWVRSNFDLSPKGIIEYLKLNDPDIIKYKEIASGGHFLKPEATWENLRKF